MKYLKELKRNLTKEKIKEYINKNKEILIISMPFLLMHLFITIMAINVNYHFYNYIAPLFFTISWLILFIGLSTKLKSALGKITYTLIYLVFLILYLVNGVYYSMMSTFFDFSLLESASEGAPYILDSLKNCNPLVYVGFIMLIISYIFAMKNFPKRKHTDLEGILKVIIIFLVCHLFAPLLLGKGHTDLTWSNWRNARNIYEAYNDSNKAIKVSGFFEYEIRNFYITYLKTEEQESEEDLEFLANAYASETHESNKFTGILKDKNLIIVQLEGMDNWIINEKDTPTIYKMMNEGINFTNHFSFYNGGGSTFNSEFAINTGFVTPYSYTKNAYSFNKNNFPNSLAKIFKDLGYKVNAFHMNTGEYYSRTINYLNWGYENYYGLKDLKTYSDSNYELDRELMLNEEFNNLIFNTENKFVDYIITYSGHLPFTNTKGVCKMLYEEDIEKQKEARMLEIELIEDETLKEEELKKLEEEFAFTEMTEEECIRRQNKETDDMMALLLEELKGKNLLDNTAIVVVTDHYLYTVEDQSILTRYKETSNNLINKTPLFIWSNDINKHTVTEVTSQLNILPTVLNLYGINYNPNNYIAEDALAPDYKGIAFFSDYSWYDGNVYVDGGVVTNGKYISEEELENKNYKVSYLTKKNDLTLKYNYFAKNKEQNND